MSFELINDLSLYDDFVVTRASRQITKPDEVKVSTDIHVQNVAFPALSTVVDIDWMKKGNCLGITDGTMFPDNKDDEGIETAKAICIGCPVIKTCLDEALEKREKFGVRGGMSERERFRVLKQRKRDANKQAALDEKSKIA